MSVFKAQKVVSALPGTLDPDTIYLVRVGEGFDLYCSDTTGTLAHKVNGLTENTVGVVFDGGTSSTTFYPITINLGGAA